VAWARRHPHHGGLPAHGSFRKARGGGSSHSTCVAPRAIQGARRADRLSVGGRISIFGVSERRQAAYRREEIPRINSDRRHDYAVLMSNRGLSPLDRGLRIKPPWLDRASAVMSRSPRWRGALEPMLSCEAACAHVHTGLLLADHAPQYARCARRPLPAMARSRSFSPAAKRRHSSRGNKIAQPAILR
jgi:hypothetical protein